MKAHAVFERVGPEAWIFIGTFQCESKKDSLREAQKTRYEANDRPDLVAFPWECGTTLTRTGFGKVDESYLAVPAPWILKK